MTDNSRTDPDGLVTKLDQNWPRDLMALKSPEWKTVDIPDTQPAFDPGLPNIPFDIKRKQDIWEQLILQLKDVPWPDFDNDVGKSLIFNPFIDSEGDYKTFQYGLPQKLGIARNFSISGDGIADPVPFDGSADVDLVITVNQAAHANSADNATHATSADTATNASHATTADSATNATHATTADSATTATTATTATNANHATTADSATNATNATNANHATTADSATTAGGLSGGLTVTLTGDVTGTGNISGGTVTVDTTIAGGGGSGSTTGDGSLIIGSVKQAWGRGSWSIGSDLIITFPTGIEFSTANSYVILVSIEGVGFSAGDVAFTLSYSNRTQTGFKIEFSTTDVIACNYNYFVAGN